MMWKAPDVRKKILIIVLTVVIFCFGFYHFVLASQLKAFAEIKDKLLKEEEKLASAQMAAASLKKELVLNRRVKMEYEAEGKLFEKDMKDGSDLVVLGLRAAASNVQITGVEPAGVTSEGHVLMIPLKITAEGDYQNILSFCSSIENLPALSEIRSLKLESQNSGAGGGGQVRATIGLVIYSARAPRKKFNVDDISKWRTGRSDLFEEPDLRAPVPELSSHLAVSSAPSGEKKDQSFADGQTEAATQTVGIEK